MFISEHVRLRPPPYRYGGPEHIVVVAAITPEAWLGMRYALNWLVYRLESDEKSCRCFYQNLSIGLASGVRYAQ